jgi:S-phase kinase-associated protein 1
LLAELILSANYMDIKPLFELCAAKYAYHIRGRTPEEIGKIFGIINNYTESERQELDKKYNWIE